MGHLRLWFDDQPTCAEKDCRRVFNNQSKLQQHADNASHSAFQCLCGKAYTKLWSLTRHIKEEVEKPRFECPVNDFLIYYIRYPCQRTFARISHLETHLRKIHKKTPDEIEAIVRPLRKNKSSKSSPKGGSPAAVVGAVTTAASRDNASISISALVNSDLEAPSRPVGNGCPSRTDSAGVLTTTSTPLGDQTGHQFPQLGSFNTTLIPGLPARLAGAYTVSSGGWPNAAAHVDPVAAESVAGPTDAATAAHNMFGYGNAAFRATDPSAYLIATIGRAPSTTAIQPAPFNSYNPAYFGNMNTQQGGFPASSARGLFGHQPQHPTVPGDAFVRLPPLFGYGQATAPGDAIGQQGMSFGSAATAAAGYPNHQGAYPPALGGTSAAYPPYPSAGFGGYGQFGNDVGVGGAHQNAFLYGPEGTYLTSNSNEHVAVAPNNFSMSTTGYAYAGASSVGQGVYTGPFNAASGEGGFAGTNDIGMDDFSSFDGTNFGNFGNSDYNAGW